MHSRITWGQVTDPSCRDASKEIATLIEARQKRA